MNRNRLRLAAPTLWSKRFSSSFGASGLTAQQPYRALYSTRSYLVSSRTNKRVRLRALTRLSSCVGVLRSKPGCCEYQAISVVFMRLPNSFFIASSWICSFLLDQSTYLIFFQALVDLLMFSSRIRCSLALRLCVYSLISGSGLGQIFWKSRERKWPATFV